MPSTTATMHALHTVARKSITMKSHCFAAAILVREVFLLATIFLLPQAHAQALACAAHAASEADRLLGSYGP